MGAFLVDEAKPLVLAFFHEDNGGFVVVPAAVEEEEILVEDVAQVQAGVLGAQVVRVGFLFTGAAAPALLQVVMEAGGFTRVDVGEGAAELQVLAYEI